LRSGYVRFYAQYGVTPEDVGVSQQHIITGTLRFCVAASLLRSWPTWARFFGAVAMLAIYGVIAWIVLGFCVRSRRLTRAVKTTPTRILVIGIAYLSVLLIFLVSFAFVFARSDLKSGSEAIGKGQRVDIDSLTFLMVQADPAHVIWLAGDTNRPVGFPSSSTKVVHLGHSNGTSVVYVPDPTDPSIWRVPEDKALIKIIGSDASA
jgi:hypothetical protein